MSPSANEGDDDMHERRVRSPSAPFRRAGAAALLREGPSAGVEIPRLASCGLTAGLIIHLPPPASQ